MAEKNEERNPIEMILDENNTENVKLYDAENNCVEFEQIAVIPLEEKIYAIMRPISGLEGIVAEDEALVYGIEEIDGEYCLEDVESDDIVDQVFDLYYELLKEEGVEV